jgi:hypothetical protein
LPFRQADAEALPFADNTFNAIAIGFGAHHFPCPVRALVEARRVLRPGGRLGFTVWASFDEHMIQKVVVDAVRETDNPVAALPVPPAGEINDIGTCVRLLREAGFSSPAPRAEKLESRASIESARQLIDLLTDGTVRMSAVIQIATGQQSGGAHRGGRVRNRTLSGRRRIQDPGGSHIGCRRQGVAVANCSVECGGSPCDVGFLPLNLRCHVTPLGRMREFRRCRQRSLGHPDCRSSAGDVGRTSDTGHWRSFKTWSPLTAMEPRP